MSPRASLNHLPATQEEFEAWCTGPDGPELGHFEFLHGCIVAEPPANWPHGRIGGSVCAKVGAFVEERRLGLFFDSSQGFALPSGDTVEPDVAVILAATWAAAPRPRAQFLRVVPDLVVEVLSPRTAWRDRSVKREIYERNGVREYWLLDPRWREITVLTRGRRGGFLVSCVATGDTPARSALLRGFAMRPCDVFPGDD
jgi:Uma2 family endonuclease